MSNSAAKREQTKPRHSPVFFCCLHATLHPLAGVRGSWLPRDASACRKLITTNCLLRSVADGEGIKRGGLGAAEADSGLREAVKGVDAVGGKVPDEEVAVPVGGEAHRVELKGADGLRVGGVGLGLALGGGHVDLLVADGVPGGRCDGLHAWNLGDDLCHVGEEVGAFALLLGEAVDVELG